MIVNSLNTDYRINFRYNRNEQKHPVVTICNIESVHHGERFKDNSREIGCGIAVCHSKDNFSKAEGRKIALQRALLNTSKKVRKIIWDGYFQNVRK